MSVTQSKRVEKKHTVNIMFNAPVDVRLRAVPVKVFEKESSRASKYYPDKVAITLKDIFIEQARRKVPRLGFADRRVTIIPVEVAGDERIRWDSTACDIGVDICDSSLFLEDLDYVEPKPELPGPYDPERVQLLYKRACESLRVTPCNLFLRSSHTGRLNASNQGIGPVGARAVAISLITSLTVTELHISGNKLGPEGMDCMAKLFEDNETIKVLDIDNNELGRAGGKILAACIMINDSIQQINAAGNKFDDVVCKYLAEALKVNQQIRQLDLSHNFIGSKGLKLLAQALEVNNTIGHLDVSYNHIQSEGLHCTGYRGIQSMLKVNTGLLSLTLAWNGIDKDAAKLLGNGLAQNNTLCVLDLTGCRLNVLGFINLIMCGKENKNLKSLLMRDNPITNADLMFIIRAVHSLRDSAISFIDAQSVTVSGDFLKLVDEVRESRPGFVVTYRGTFSLKDRARNMLESLDLTGGDPLEALIKYTKTKNLRLVDVFARIDTDKSGSVTRQELIHGVAQMGIPLSIKQLDNLVAKLDKDGDGEIDYGELLEGYKKFMRRMHKQGFVARTMLKLDYGYFPAPQVPRSRRTSNSSIASTRSRQGSVIQIPQSRKVPSIVEDNRPGAYLTAAYGDPEEDDELLGRASKYDIVPKNSNSNNVASRNRAQPESSSRYQSGQAEQRPSGTLETLPSIELRKKNAVQYFRTKENAKRNTLRGSWL